MNPTTTDENIEDKELQTIKHKTESSPTFEAGIDPITLLETLDNHIETLNNNPDENETQRVQSELSSMEVITMEHEGRTWWINEPLALQRYVMRRPMSKRISHLLKTKGEWKEEYVKKDSLDVKSRVRLPIYVTIRTNVENQIKNGEVSTLLLSIVGLRNTIEGMLETGVSSCGVFRRPNGVVHMNKLKLWLEDNANHGVWDIKDNLNIVNLFDIANTAALITN